MVGMGMNDVSTLYCNMLWELGIFINELNIVSALFLSTNFVILKKYIFYI